MSRDAMERNVLISISALANTPRDGSWRRDTRALGADQSSSPASTPRALPDQAEPQAGHLCAAGGCHCWVHLPPPGWAARPRPPALSRGLSPGPAVSPDLPVPGRPFGDSASFRLSFCYSVPLSVPPRFSASSTALGSFSQARALSHSSVFQRAAFSPSPPIAGLLLSDSLSCHLCGSASPQSLPSLP